MMVCKSVVLAIRFAMLDTQVRKCWIESERYDLVSFENKAQVAKIIMPVCGSMINL